MTKITQMTTRERQKWIQTTTTGELIGELHRRALAEPNLRGLILHRMSEVLAVIACQFGIRIGAEHDDMVRGNRTLGSNAAEATRARIRDGETSKPEMDV